MFRDVPDTGINPDVVGAGSVIGGGHEFDSQSENYLVIANANKTAVALVDNTTYTLVTPWISVENVNYLSSGECRELIKPVSNLLGWTFTDFSISTRGMKTTKFNNTGSR